MFKNNKIVFSLILFNNLIFITLFAILSFYNRIATDDFYFLSNVNKYGIIQATINEHAAWSGRWMSVLLNHFVLSFYPNIRILFFFGIATLGLFIYAVKRLLHNIILLISKKNLGIVAELNISVFFISAFFYSTFKIDETWFWLCSSCTYLLSIVMFFLGLSAIISQRNNLLNACIYMLSFIYIGGSSEPFALILLFIIPVTAVALYFNYLKLAISKKIFITRLIIAFIFCLVSFIVLYSGKGNTNRMQNFDHITILSTFILNIKATGMIILLRLPYILPFLILFSIPIYYLGYINTSEIVQRESIINRIALIVLSYFTLLFLFQLPVTYITQDIAAYRTLLPITLFTLFTVSAIAYNLGLLIKLNYKLNRILVITSFIILIGNNIWTLIDQIKTLPKYAVAYDKRINYIIENRNSTTPVFLDPLPPSGLLMSAEITNDSLYFSNIHLRSGLNCKSPIILAEKSVQKMTSIKRKK